MWGGPLCFWHPYPPPGKLARSGGGGLPDVALGLGGAKSQRPYPVSGPDFNMESLFA